VLQPTLVVKCELGGKKDIANNNLKNTLRREEDEEITLAIMRRVTQQAKDHTRKRKILMGHGET